MKLWVGYSSSHSAGFHVCARFSDGAAAATALQLLRLVADGTRAKLAPSEVASPFDAQGLDEALADIMKAQDDLDRADVYRNGPHFSVRLREAYEGTSPQPFLQMDIQSASTGFEYGLPFGHVTDALMGLLQRLGAVSIEVVR